MSLYWLFFVMVWRHAKSEDCLAIRNLHLTQDTLARRPADKAMLTCVLSGKLTYSLQYYQWKIYETDELLYVNRPDNTLEYSAEGLHESHGLSDKLVISKVLLPVNFNEDKTYVCEFVISGHENCSVARHAHIKYEDPVITLQFEQSGGLSNMSAEVNEVICMVNTSAGKPTISIEYSGEDRKKFQVIKRELEVKDHQNYFVGVMHAMVQMPSTGNILCTVEDWLGIYHRSMPLVKTGIKGVARVPILPSYYITLIGSLVSIIFFSTVVKKLWKGKHGVRESICWKRLPGRSISLRRCCKRFLQELIRIKWYKRERSESQRHPYIYKVRRQELNRIPDEGENFNLLASDCAVEGETGVLAVLHSLIASGHGEQILKNVYDAVDPNEVETNIKLWRYGEVCKVPIELNIEQRSNVSNVSKIDLIEMAYNKVLDSHNIWNAESDIHMMEDLTGGIVDRAQIMEITWDYLWISFNNNWPMTCMRRVGTACMFYCIANLRENDQERIVNVLHIRKEHGKKYIHRKPMNERTFIQYFDEIHILRFDMEEDLLRVIIGKWHQTRIGENIAHVEFWRNRQYLMEFDSTDIWSGNSIQVELALMQEIEKKRDKFSVPSKALHIGCMVFKITEKCPDYAFTQYDETLHLELSANPRHTREFLHSVVGHNKDRFLIVPCASGVAVTERFILRLYSKMKDAVKFRKLNHQTTSNEKGNIDNSS